MSTVTNPLWSNLVPGGAPSNPTGTNISVGGGSTGTNPLLPPTNMSTTAPTNPNPLTAGVPPAFPANTGGGYQSSLNLGSPGSPTGTPTTNVGAAAQSPIGGMNMMNQKDLGRLFNSLRNTYGDGMAHTIMNFLTSGAGFNQQAVNNMLASLQPGIERGTESLMEQFSASGNRFGSGAEIGLGDYLSQVNLNEGQIVTKMYEDAVQNYINVMMGVAPATATEKLNSPSAWDYAQQAANFAEGLMSGGMVGGGGGKKQTTVPSSGGPIGSTLGNPYFSEGDTASSSAWAGDAAGGFAI